MAVTFPVFQKSMTRLISTDQKMEGENERSLTCSEQITIFLGLPIRASNKDLKSLFRRF